jgi:hypothetical protein
MDRAYQEQVGKERGHEAGLQCSFFAVWVERDKQPIRHDNGPLDQFESVLWV